MTVNNRSHRMGSPFILAASSSVSCGASGSLAGGEAENTGTRRRLTGANSTNSEDEPYSRDS